MVFARGLSVLVRVGSDVSPACCLWTSYDTCYLLSTVSVHLLLLGRYAGSQLTGLLRHVQTVLSVGWSCYDVLTTYVDGGLSFSSSGATAQPATTLYANPISVAWQESDLSLFSPASAPILALRGAGVTFPSSPTPSTTNFSSVVPTNSSPAPKSHGDSGLSKGSAAGIGIGAAIVCIALCGGLWYFGRRLKLSRSHKLRAQQDIHNDRSRKLEDRGIVPENAIIEADAAHFISELDGGWQPPEAIGSVTIKPIIERKSGGNIK